MNGVARIKNKCGREGKKKGSNPSRWGSDDSLESERAEGDQRTQNYRRDSKSDEIPAEDLLGKRKQIKIIKQKVLKY